MARLTLDTQDDRGVRVLAAQGEIDMGSSPRFLQAIKHGLHAGAVVVDLARIDYIDSSGIAVLIQGLKEARRLGRQFRLRNPSSRVTAVLELAQLQRLFDIERTGANVPPRADTDPAGR